MFGFSCGYAYPVKGFKTNENTIPKNFLELLRAYYIKSAPR